MTIPKLKEANIMQDQFFGQVSESIQLVFDLTSRIDERVKMLIQKQTDLEGKFDRLLDSHQIQMSRLSILEHNSGQNDSKKDHENTKIEELKTKMQNIEIKMEMAALKSGASDSRWLQIFDAFWKIVLMVTAGYILYKLGLPTPG